MKRRAFKRYTKRLETEFTGGGGGETRRGISSDLSERGLFVRSRHSLPPGSPVELTVYLPDDTHARVQGIVRRNVKDVTKIGMGIEVTDYDEAYRRFLQMVLENGGEPDKRTPDTFSQETPPADATPFAIIVCPSCDVRNKVPTDKLSRGPRCGKCKEPLPTG
jgi:hypothetical protein